MPLLPFITDTAAHLEETFQAFKTAGAAYLFPATLTLFGSAPSDSKTLVLNAVAKHYPHLLEKYHRFFAGGSQMPAYYRQAFTQKMAELCRQYRIGNSLFKR
jgi:DNA repair photolyase